MKLKVLGIKGMMGIKGLSQKTLAQNMGMSPQNVSRLLCTGRCFPGTAVKLASALGVDLEEIVKDE